MKKLKALLLSAGKSGFPAGDESGVSLMEILVSLAVLGIVAAVFLSGLATMAKANFIVDERSTAESLAQSQMEYVRSADYVPEATQYSPAPIPSDEDYANYAVSIYAQPLNSPDNGIQKITVSVSHHAKEVITLVSYKVQ